MDQQVFEAGKLAYQQGDWATAAAQLQAAKTPGEVNGGIDHLLGNALMKLGRYPEAATAYEQALRDASYGKVGALSCNRGRALMASGSLDEAVAALTDAIEDRDYATPYKAYMALGNVQSKRGDVRSAGVAYRNAAIDETNPDPAKALTKLGGCFMQLGRPVDAIEAFRTALDFSQPAEDQDAIYAELGSAYVAANRMSEAVDAFGHATAGGYRLTATQQASYDAANKAAAAISGRGPSETDDLLKAAGFGASSSGSYDPLDPLGKSGEFMPNPEDTGFFTLTEQDIMVQEAGGKKRKKKGNGFLKFLLFVLILLILAGAAGGFLYYRGFGWPTQQAVVEGFFDARGSGDIGDYLSPQVTAAARAEIEAIVPAGATVSVEGTDQNMTNSTVQVKATLAEGGEQIYNVWLVRDGISWKITAVELVYDSLDEAPAEAGSTSTTTTTGTVSPETATE